MAPAAVVRERLDTRFDLWDNDGDGELRRDDLEAEARKILRAFGVAESSPRGHALMIGYNDIWTYIAAKAGGGDTVTREQFERVGTAIVAGGDAGWAEVVRPHITAMLQLCDGDGDGQLGRSEFAAWLKAVGAGVEADEIFDQIDTDDDGYLSIQELGEAVKAYGNGTTDLRLLG